MNERLSRVERHRHRSNSKPRTSRSRVKPAASDLDSVLGQDQGREHESSIGSLRMETEIPTTADITLSSLTLPGYLLVTDDSQEEPDKEEVSEVTEMPTRREMFPSQRLKLTRWFYNSLLYIFVIILVFLFWWGLSESPWGKSHGL